MHPISQTERERVCDLRECAMILMSDIFEQ